MSNAEMNSGRAPSAEASGAKDAESEHHELKIILDAIASQLFDADRRQAATLHEMQDRIADLGREAEALRQRVPEEFSSAVERIETGVAGLAQRLPHASESQAAGSGASAPSHSAPDGSWPEGSADPFDFVHSDDGAKPPRSTGAATDQADRAPPIDQVWLEKRLSEIGQGIEQSLAGIKPDQGFSAIGQRLDQFEETFGRMFEGVATRADFDAVRLIEQHVGEVVDRLERTHDQMARLNAMEEQLSVISRSLAGGKGVALASDAGANPPVSAVLDAEAIARDVAERTSQHIRDLQSTPGDSASELKPLIERMMAQSRQSEENIADLLDTLQQAMTRLLDRVESIEAGRPAGPSKHPAAYGHAADFGESEPQPARDLDLGSSAYAAAEATPTPKQTSASRHHAVLPAAESEPGEVAVSSHEKMRQDLIAEARRARMRLAAETDEQQSSEPLADVESSAPSGMGRPIRPTAATAKTSAPTGPSLRLILIGIAALLALGGLWYTWGGSSGKVAISQAPASAANDQSKAGEASKTVTPSNGTGPRSDLDPAGARPMPGVAVDATRPISSEALQTAERHQAMAHISGEMAVAAARKSDPSTLPSSLVPSEAEVEGTVKHATQAPAGMVVSTPLDMPAATVGPYSLRFAAAKGDPSAQFEVGARIAEGKGTPQSFEEAAKWYQRAAEQGLAQAQYRLGTLYERGLGLKANPDLAANWYRRAAEQGNIKAMHNLAVMSASASGKSPDYTAAAQWFEEAAKHGLVDSQYNLAVLYENGLGVKRDLKQAYMWLSLAARGGDRDATQNRDELGGKLSPSELDAAEQMAADWQPASTNRDVNDARAAGEAWKKNPKNGANG